MLKHSKGDLLHMAEDGQFDVIVQGCNCFNAMGAGIALSIKKRYPLAYEVDTRLHHEYPSILKLGMYSRADVQSHKNRNRKFTIINAYTQVEYAGRGKDLFEYASFEVILRKLESLFGDKRIGFPYIGMGLAGGDKTKIIDMLECFAERVEERGGEVTLVEFAPVKKRGLPQKKMRNTELNPQNDSHTGGKISK